MWAVWQKTHPGPSVFGVRWVWDVCESGLPLAYVPVQTLSQTFKPVVNQVVTTDRRYRVTRCSDLNAARRKTDRHLIRLRGNKNLMMKLKQPRTVCELHQSPCWISCLLRPSNDTQAVFLASGERVICFRQDEVRLFVSKLMKVEQH